MKGDDNVAREPIKVLSSLPTPRTCEPSSFALFVAGIVLNSIRQVERAEFQADSNYRGKYLGETSFSQGRNLTGRENGVVSYFYSKETTPDARVTS